MLLSPSLDATGAVDKAWQLSGEERVAFEMGEMVVRTVAVGDGHIKQVEAFLIIKASPKKVFDLITNYSLLPDFMPNLENIDVLESDAYGAVVNYYLSLPFGVEKKYRLQLDYDTTPPDFRMTWKSLPWQGLEPEETVKNTVGYWSLKAIGNDETRLHYYTKTDPGYVPFGLGWVVDYLTKESVVDLLESTKERAEME